MINLIVAYNNKRVIGKDNKLPWHIPEDLKRFRQLTENNIVVMGRKTHESIGKVLPQRINVVLTKKDFYKPFTDKKEIIIVSPNINEVLSYCKKKYQDKEIFIIGGEEIYRQTLSMCDRLYITKVDTNEEGDSHFPEFNEDKWITVESNLFEGYEFLTLKKES